MNNPAESQGAVAGPGGSSPAGGCHPPFPPREKSNLLLLWSRASHSQLLAPPPPLQFTILSATFSCLSAAAGSGRQRRAGQSPIISQSKCLGWKLWIVWLRSPAWSAGEEGPKYIYTSAANWLIGEVVQSRRRPLLGPSPGHRRSWVIF